MNKVVGTILFRGFATTHANRVTMTKIATSCLYTGWVRSDTIYAITAWPTTIADSGVGRDGDEATIIGVDCSKGPFTTTGNTALPSDSNTNITIRTNGMNIFSNEHESDGTQERREGR